MRVAPPMANAMYFSPSGPSFPLQLSFQHLAVNLDRPERLLKVVGCSKKRNVRGHY